MITGSRLTRYFLYCVLYLIWGSIYIANTSFVAIDGARYYSLFDDAMISMRYAWNFSHGEGLVWNPGEHVEGYSNLLMTLIMSLFTLLFDKKMAVLGVQIFGLFVVIMLALQTARLYNGLSSRKTERDYFSVFVCAMVLVYYPLSYWSLFGMETGLLALLILSGIYYTSQWLDIPNQRNLFLVVFFWGLAFLTRNDSLIFVAITILYWGSIAFLNRDRDQLRNLLLSAAGIGLFVLGQEVFRWGYYGELVPNTYVLKMEKVHYLIRINDGLLYTWAFLREQYILFLFAIGGLISMNNSRMNYFALLILGAFGYQIWVGGDAWFRWRFMVPVMPLVILLAIVFMADISNRLIKIADGFRADTRWVKIVPVFSFVIYLFGCYHASIPYISELKFKSLPLDVQYNRRSVNIAVALNDILTDDARIGVFWAGTIPYYTEKYAIDFLGKSDRHVAALYPHIPDEYTWLYRITLPGHNKYDLNYSIRELKPDYIQRYYWDQQNIRRYALENYVRFEYTGVAGQITLQLKKNSPYVKWDKGKLLKWGE
ncbi:MAG: hypothetical protein HYZ24_01515 [Chloroflexi bacterium]|nr:hypothetical protein [Chloroflexota bacterium]